GSIKVENDKLIIAQETVGGNPWSLQALNPTDIILTKNQMYKITMTITSTTNRFIDIVTKAPNNDYGNDTHSIIDVKIGTHQYDMVFKAFAPTLFFNIMTGTVEGTTNAGAGTLEFSNFVLWQGPIQRDYVELAGFFDNPVNVVGKEMEYITTTDANYVRTFYYWDESNGTILAGEYTDNGFEVEVLKNPSNTWGAQLQWNDMNKAGTALKKDAWYKLSMTINSPVARTIRLEVTGSHHTMPVSKGQDISLNVGNNDIVMEFKSAYDYFFMKILFGNYGDPVQMGVYTVSNLKLAEEVGAVDPVDPNDPAEVIGNVFGTLTNVKGSDMFFDGINGPTEIEQNTIYLWKGIVDWFGGWASFPVVTGSVNAAGQVVVDIDATGPEFWAIQLKYKGGEVSIGVDYVFAFHVYSEVARKINVQLKDPGFGGAFVDKEVVLHVGLNVVEVPFKAVHNTFNVQWNLGDFEAEVNEAGTLVFDNFMVTRQVELVENYVENGDFAVDMPVLGATDALGWALWTTAGIGDSWALPNYGGTITIADGVLKVNTTAKGGADWAAQIQYNAPTNDLVVGAVYKVAVTITSNVSTTIALQFKGVTDGGPHSTVVVTLNVGVNNVVVYLTAMQAQMRLFLLVGLTEPGTMLTFDNVQVFKPVMPDPVDPVDPVDPEVLVPVLVPNGIFNGDFNAEGFAVGAEGSGWGKWTTQGNNWGAKEVDATFTVVDGKI
ncbi:MAG: hypothetical protein U1C51_02795, partial [Candidatus Izemoplasmatales bacterium]|nr:hypothetical protein [Candidatus Izemoplasmatales bacterium]